MSILLTIIISVIFAEFAGYLVHVLIHSEKIRALSKEHMIHHIHLYGPKSSQLASSYQVSTNERINILGIGLEWWIPLGIMALVFIGILSLFGMSVMHMGIFIITGGSYGFFAFSYMHRAMHIKDFWMERVPVLKIWFKKLRKLHVLHHLVLDADGRQRTNYGICFFIFDRIFGTLCLKPRHNDENALKQLYERWPK